jgi:hypothetical protein
MDSIRPVRPPLDGGPVPQPIQRLELEREFPKDSNDSDGFSRPQMTYGGEYGGYNTQRDYDQRPQTQLGPSGMLMPQMRTM